MALSQVAFKVEQALGRGGEAVSEQGISNPSNNVSRFADPSGERMKAVTWQGKNTVKVEETFKPAIVEPADIIVRTTGTTICGSDLHLIHGVVMEMHKGDILGHEFCGVVESVGPSITKLKPGDRVVCSFQIACGQCRYCAVKLSSQCERTNDSTIMNSLYGGRTSGIIGYSHLMGGYAGGQAEYVRVPFGDVNLLKIPDNVPDEKALYLSDVLCTSWNCVVDTGVAKGDVVAIWGAGPIGQMCAEMSFINGASRVILIDGGDASWRLEWVKERIPKLETVNYSDLPKGESITSQLKKMTGGQGVDVALECAAGEYAKGWAHYFELLLGLETDTSEIINEMITSCRAYGRCGVTGAYVGFTNHFNIGSLMERGIRLIGNGQAPVHKYWEKLLGMIETGELDPLRMVSHRVVIDDMDQVYMKYNSREKGMQKVYVQTKFSAPPCQGSPQLTRY
ncbi:alcohol dehydrogenase [Gamsiella multidivaricata]|uniref:alcohol dehydrogenase n=1 Tax=Gamsiella multidivaricata TaxID=101098 RepID=UPI0022201758|nr:alcohol dehydrogenase [Gamsiella multidivaricata]KAI7829861.1 alcohol dehydrogenase [Gamsiella multidivaricata]